MSLALDNTANNIADALNRGSPINNSFADNFARIVGFNVVIVALRNR